VRASSCVLLLSLGRRKTLERATRLDVGASPMPSPPDLAVTALVDAARAGVDLVPLLADKGVAGLVDR